MSSGLSKRNQMKDWSDLLRTGAPEQLMPHSLAQLPAWSGCWPWWRKSHSCAEAAATNARIPNTTEISGLLGVFHTVHKEFATSVISFLFYVCNPQVSPSFNPNKTQNNDNHNKARGFYPVSFGKEVFPYHHCHLDSLTTSWKPILPRPPIIAWLLNLMDVTSCFSFWGCGWRDSADNSLPMTLPHLLPPHAMLHMTYVFVFRAPLPPPQMANHWVSLLSPSPHFSSCLGFPGWLYCFLWVQPSPLKAQLGTEKKYLC